jgi:hypothetical protein
MKIRICLHIAPRPSSLEPYGLPLTFLSCGNDVAGTCGYVGALGRFFLTRKSRTSETDTGW